MTTQPRNGNDAARYAVFLSVNHDRAAVGLPPLQYAEFINVGNLLRGARDYWTPEKLAEKAKKQFRDPEGKFREMRGKLPGSDLHRAGRARIGKQAEEVDELRLPGAVGSMFELGSPPASSPRTKVTRLSQQAGLKAMINAGHDPKEVIARYNGRGVIYRVDNPGENPIHVFVASPKAMVDARMEVQDNNVGNAKTALAKFQEQAAAMIKAGDPEAGKRLEELQEDVARAERLRKLQKAKAEAHYGTGGDEIFGEAEQQLAEEVAALFMRATEDWPQWKLRRQDGRPLPFILEFDESKLVPGEAKNGPLPAADITSTPNAIASGSDRINFSRVRFREEMVAGQKSTMPTDLETAGQHAVAHEVGHLLDQRGGKNQYPWDSNGDKFTPYITASRGIVNGAYLGAPGVRANREWFAEMHALSKQDPGNLTAQQRIAVQAYLNMWMIRRMDRPGAPTTEWITDNQAWLQQAVAAFEAGQPLPAPPHPGDYYDTKPKVQKKKLWGLPGQKK